MVVLYYTIFKAPEDDETREKLFKILNEISKKDETFVWGASKNRKYITIISESEQQAWARGYWIKQKSNMPKDYLEKLVFKIFKVEMENR